MTEHPAAPTTSTGIEFADILRTHDTPHPKAGRRRQINEWIADIEAEARAAAHKEVLDVERLADDVRWGYSKSEYSRGFNDGIDALIARLASLSTDTREEPT